MAEYTSSQGLIKAAWKLLLGADQQAVTFGGIRGVDSTLERELVVDTFQYFLSKVLPGLMGLLSVLLFVRLVGFEEYGRYAVVLAVVLACSYGASGWLSQGILRFQSNHPQGVGLQDFRRAVVLGTLLSLVIGGLGLGVILFFSSLLQREWVLLLSLVLFAVVLVYAVILAQFQALLRSASVMRWETNRATTAFLIPALLVWMVGTKDHSLLLIGILLGYVVPILFHAMVNPKTTSAFRQLLAAPANAHSLNVLRTLWNYGWPMALWYLCIQMLSVSDRYFIQMFCGYSDAGVYASLYDTVVRSFSLIFSPISLAVHPIVMSRWNAGDRQAALSTIGASVKFQFLLSLPILMVIALSAPWVTRIILGQVNSRASGAVLPLALGGFLWQVSGLAHKPLEILCKTRRMLLGIVVSLAVNVVGNWFLIPRFGYKASAYLTLGSSLSYLLMLALLTPKESLRRQILLAKDPTQVIPSAEGHRRT